MGIHETRGKSDSRIILSYHRSITNICTRLFILYLRYISTIFYDNIYFNKLFGNYDYTEKTSIVVKITIVHNCKCVTDSYSC